MKTPLSTTSIRSSDSNVVDSTASCPRCLGAAAENRSEGEFCFWRVNRIWLSICFQKRKKYNSYIVNFLCVYNTTFFVSFCCCWFFLFLILKGIQKCLSFITFYFLMLICHTKMHTHKWRVHFFYSKLLSHLYITILLQYV